MEMKNQSVEKQPAKKRRLSRRWGNLGWLLLALCVLIIAVTLLFYYTDVTLPLHAVSEAEAAFCTEGQTILQNTDAGAVAFTVQGVHIDPVSGDDAYEQYMTLLSYAAELSANTVVVDDVMEPAFYEAFLAFNSGRTSPIYLLQGVRLSDETYADMEDAYEGKMVEKLVARGKLAIDAVHGSRRTKDACYTADVSDETLGFLIGQDWDSDLVLYTNYVYSDIAGEENGRFVSVYSNADAFDKLLGRVFNKLFAYETRKFGEQHILGLQNGQITDPLSHDSLWAPGLNENLAHVNAEVLSNNVAVRSGIIAAYHVDTAIVQTLSYDPAYSEYVDSSGQKNPYLAYLMALKDYHVDTPVIVSSVSVSSGRGVSGIDAVSGVNRGGLTEDEQASDLVWLCESTKAAGLCGVCIDSLVDNALNTAWNTDSSVVSNGNWLNAQDSEQNLGLIALEPGASETICTVDGDDSEWSNIPAVLRSDGFQIKMTSDEKYLYLCLNIPDYNENQDVLYLAFDVTPESGGLSFDSQNLTFDRAMDFVLSINGSRRAQMYVQEYYDKLNTYYGEDWSDVTVWSPAPEKSSAIFDTIGMFVREALPEEVGEVAEDPVVVETGLLRYGNADPMSEDYDSLADYCIDGTCVEIRLPWTLLNFVDPSNKLIEGNLFLSDSESIPIDSIYVSLIVSQDNALAAIGDGKYQLTQWDTGAYHFRKKEAFNAIAEWFS